MPTVLFYDSETQSLPLWDVPSEDPRQPHIVELAAILATRDEVTARFHSVVKPDGWTIPDHVAKIHGITTERALAEGRPEADVLREFNEIWRQADLRVAHSEQFDSRILRIAYKRFLPAMADEWKAGRAKCTANLSDPICKLPPTEKMIKAGFGNKFKRPSLEEAHRIIVGEELPRPNGVHGAEVDAAGCLAIYRKIWEMQNA